MGVFLSHKELTALLRDSVFYTHTHTYTFKEDKLISLTRKPERPGFYLKKKNSVHEVLYQILMRASDTHSQLLNSIFLLITRRFC